MCAASRSPSVGRAYIDSDLPLFSSVLGSAELRNSSTSLSLLHLFRVPTHCAVMSGQASTYSESHRFSQ